ncbi:PolC-type DNA polymerase III [Mycoplasma crocodyli]|uniref:DNA polymerase III PolC-type n=1 Tax=Mycoplasma crocodyli (strain ATCC 51981 / MP145) TaxID=512564 RepID=D5E4L5_MYCCM|nr:PolC-type DNA polymerase III [Mycoplasma crocodyli]ADE19965.1 DNA polymerase III, polC-type alpha subunit [Mycoplasma crocodyli MP145]
MTNKKYYQDETFNKFMEFLHVPKIPTLREAFIPEPIHFEFVNEQYIFYVNISIPSVPKISDFDILLKRLKVSNGQKFIVNFKIINSINDAQYMKDYILYIIENFQELEWIKLRIDDFTFNANHTIPSWRLCYYDESLKLNVESACEFINRELNKIGFLGFNIYPDYLEYVQNKNTESLQNLQDLIDEKLRKIKTEDVVFSKIGTKKFTKNTRNKNYLKRTIEQINNDEIEEKTRVSFNGYVYKSDYSVSKNEKHIYTFSITDYKDAIEVKWFLNEQLDKDRTVNVGDFVFVEGSLSKNMRDVVFVFADDVAKQKDNKKIITDDSEIKRVELNTKSKMNTMDGILTPIQLINKAKELGHRAVALLDSNSVQGFPDFYNAAKKAKIKPILGATFSTIPQSNNSVSNFQKDGILKEQEYVCFDIETTGLSPRYHELIEFGATIIKNGSVISREQFFIKAKNSLSAFTINLTGITDQMLKNEGLELKPALLKISKLFENRIAVAHNSTFDMNFLFQKFLDNKMEIPKTTFIDTLVVSRLLFSKDSKHRLENYVGRLGIIYNSDAAHRADYDAEILANAWIPSMNLLAEININTIVELRDYKSNQLYFKKFSDDVSVIALNQKGLKELFNFVSLSLTERMYNQPKIFFEDIKRSKNILVGSSTLNGLVINALFFKNDTELRNYIEKFDYIEIPCLSNFKHWIEYGDFKEEDIKNALKYLVKTAKEMKKIVVAVGDVRYINETEKTAYSLLVYAKAIGGDRHYLFDYKRKHDLKLPERFYLTTEQMIEEFSFLEDKLAYEIVVENTNLITDKINEIEVIKKDLYTPKFDDSPTKLKDLVYKTAREKYGEKLPEIVENRIKKEINPILKYGYDVIYWISHKLVKKSIDNGYLVGSRGSVGSSLVATLSGITEVNPLPPHFVCPKCKKFELIDNLKISSGFDLDDKECEKCKITMDKDGQTIPFETFLGFEADKVPDIDLNFSGDYQGEIHNEIRRLFGENHTFRAGTIATAASKTSYGYIKNALDESGKKISSTFVDYLTSIIEGVKRGTGQHPGGIIIIPKEYSVEDFTPINFPGNDVESDWKTTHFDFHAIHDNVLKLDILGHDDPTAIKMLERLTGVDVKKDIPKKDKKVMSIFTSPAALGINSSQIGGEPTGALGIPEFGTPFVRKMLEQAKAKSFADLISLSGLSHGTDVWLNNAQSLIKEKGHTIDQVISCRDDIMVYLIKHGVDSLYAFKIMEQVRKGKGITEEQEQDLRKNKIPQWYIDSMKKIKYMFPKAHATAYVLMAWRIAWFKVYKPLEYYATFFTTRCDVFDVANMCEDFKITKINNRIAEINSKPINEISAKEANLIPVLEIARELYARGFTISKISITKSLEKEWVIDYQNKTIIPPFSALDSLGDSTAYSITQARKEKPFISKEDFANRTSVSKTQYAEFEKLGVFKELPESDQNTLF